eukprot:1969091-Pyramimonas_sp.AAC.1
MHPRPSWGRLVVLGPARGPLGGGPKGPSWGSLGAQDRYITKGVCYILSRCPLGTVLKAVLGLARGPLGFLGAPMELQELQGGGPLRPS